MYPLPLSAAKCFQKGGKIVPDIHNGHQSGPGTIFPPFWRHLAALSGEGYIFSLLLGCGTSQRTLTVDTHSGHSQWTLTVDTQSGHSQRTLTTDTQSNENMYPLPLSAAKCFQRGGK